MQSNFNNPNEIPQNMVTGENKAFNQPNNQFPINGTNQTQLNQNYNLQSQTNAFSQSQNVNRFQNNPPIGALNQNQFGQNNNLNNPNSLGANQSI
jgi:hypothetical protein